MSDGIIFCLVITTNSPAKWFCI